MSITSDIRSYADDAVAQGKQLLDQAQTSLNDVTGQANDLAARARDNVADLRATAEKVVNLDAVTTAIEPYIAQFKEYSTAVTDRVEHAVEGLREDKRFAKVIDSAESLGNTVVETLNERVIKPVQSLAGRSQTTTTRPTTARKPAPKPRPSTSRPAAKSAKRKPATTRSATGKPATKTAARKSTAKRSTTTS